MHFLYLPSAQTSTANTRSKRAVCVCNSVYKAVQCSSVECGPVYSVRDLIWFGWNFKFTSCENRDGCLWILDTKLPYSAKFPGLVPCRDRVIESRATSPSPSPSHEPSSPSPRPRPGKMDSSPVSSPRPDSSHTTLEIIFIVSAFNALMNSLIWRF